MDDHDLHKQHRNSTPLRIFREIDFFDEQKKSCKIIIKPTMLSSPMKWAPSMQETDDHNQETSQEIMFPEIIKTAMLSSPKKTALCVQETSLSFFNDASTDDRYDQIKRKTTSDIDSSEGVIRLFGVNLMTSSSDSSTAGINIGDNMQETSPTFPYAWTEHRYKRRKATGNDSFEGVSAVHNNPRIIRLFGVNLLVSGESRMMIDGEDDDQETKRSKVKGKEKMVDTHNQESSQVDDKKLAASRTEGIVINEKKKNMRGNSSTKIKLRNPNFRQQQQPIAAPAVPPLFHPRILEEIQQRGGLEQRPVFLFEKKLQSSDVKSDQNRLFITRTDKLMGFLNEEERRKVYDKDDILIVIAKDTRGYEYTLHLTRWPTLDMIVLKRDWRKLVNANGLQRGDSVHGWGYRRGDEFRLALNIIRKQQ